MPPAAPDQSFARRWLAPALIYAMVPLGLVVIVWLRGRGLIADTPLWVILVVLTASPVANSLTTIYLARAPGSNARLHMRIFASAAGTAIVIYAVGWGALLVIAYAVGSAELLRSMRHSFRMLKPVLGWTYAAVLAGECLVALGWAPSVIDPGLGHAAALVGAACLTIVMIVLATTAESAEAAGADLEERSQYFQALVENAEDVIGDFSPDGTVRHVSPAISGLLGYSAHEARGRLIADHLDPRDAKLVSRVFADVLAHKGNPMCFEVRVRHRDGSYRDVVVTLTGAQRRGEDMVIANLHDVTRQRELEERLVHDARHDVLTGLLNRRAFTAAAEVESSRSRRAGEDLAVMYIDLDGFKDINDSFGHDMGDRVLVETARRLERCIRPGDVLARLGGDEFAVVVTLSDGPHPPVEVADRILDELGEPIGGLPFDVRIGASIGIAVRSDEGIEISSLIREADSAMYSAKNDGRAQWRLAQG